MDPDASSGTKLAVRFRAPQVESAPRATSGAVARALRCRLRRRKRGRFRESSARFVAMGRPQVSLIGRRRAMRSMRAVAVGALILGAVVGATSAATQGAKPAAANQFIGAAKCKNCHGSASTGDQFGKWKQQKHAKAYETLATADAKKLAKDKGIDDPQKSDACLKCHSTAFKEEPANVMKGFDPNAGVQCESCHGPGQKHMKARMAAAAAAGDDDSKVAPRVEIPKEEIVARPEMSSCTTCHNKESPSFKPFCFKKRTQEIAHLDPRDTKAAEDLKNVKCDCDECKKGGGK
jgi:hypothetical protein